MEEKHLTDEVLQEFILNEVKDHTIASHIKECVECQLRVEEYQFLFTIMLKIKPEEFSFDVTSLVLSKIYEEQSRKEKNTYIFYIILSVISLLILFLLYPYMATLFTQFRSFSIMASAFLGVCSIGIVVFLLNDLFRQYKEKEMLFSQ
ncbi:MAG TPA: hypothetical protein PLL09_03210 [Flavobacterium sp.]|uniref:hypothetical protein n=1 Tax=unclassified Flavobacterium TaxID=196869 RepID=UPI0025B98EAB|nr:MULTISPECIES: hypothetical protein [unclassified Flavobacterium]HRE76813.1 hypothetical protein [Flavobacterium sp.]